MNKKIITKSEKETFDFSKKYAKNLRGGEIIGLLGNLGAGKTVFTKGLARGLGITHNISSPTFVIMKVYPVKIKSIKRLCHIDAYRLTGENDLAAIGAQEYFGDKNTITIIEWPEKIKKILPEKTKFIEIEHLNENERVVKY
ncbi:tRNA (adenosine(37)-N6)-threonylcarbamoyltransferase complex ATPase subunit type 1 TsaE [Candidatus Falkowbacteria bacterium RIFOXYB2_FULL_34_18]|uniref:tRNA threonylcarbamoyladenosine biosynthesis protein TsaE n=1 Tax=Candidatus Falkowbacteria bacterium RIFOXYD2_FULL_34_120 TaxID=1798007 RepID=A0A1F5TQX4_9BACT|nr:MAG: tRNA (adenosine(37)-N6)-threonylcarbamoyltransferase complex ATPase subunit type 1 TsaE [Candidatus Falkowbacteria bacterium RIFOXYB2_FULL_34_18]OGF29503.1 MAG: tRNA (adenosine(37)-N6)-threonylcarbamoyltransferase complex ATPase subunit type 1 TsaE [Candidatus Falkowbacteria bacterium RIFOXYC12_FULL_34_55]OGF36320.1 MAG: tRNA (adenosine(37)-N6)-threonylcarbamoyltransferase complex ATPase subunit type 1 TsaE [Candidatus Falkowbacteria bacterium RIFOXYC2_FULL_34_220]OGF39029.1 MAG: tRNA (a